MPRMVRHYSVQKVVTRHLQTAQSQLAGGRAMEVDVRARWEEERDVFEHLTLLLKHDGGKTYDLLLARAFPQLDESQFDRMTREKTPEEIAQIVAARTGQEPNVEKVRQLIAQKKEPPTIETPAERMARVRSHRKPRALPSEGRAPAEEADGVATSLDETA